MSAERMELRIVGRVQGVGFRWWAVRHADRMGVTGWVMNADDERTVELMAEGEPQTLDRLEALVRDGPPGARIERVEARRTAASGEFTRFSIVRS
jgi:acylphosphatase